MRGLQNLLALVGRIAMVALFAGSGWSKIRDPGSVAGYMANVAHIPAGLVTPLLYVSAVIELACALLIIVGYKTRYAAIVLFLWLIPVTYLFHLSQGDPINTMKNLAIMGGLLVLAAHGPGEFAVD